MKKLSAMYKQFQEFIKPYKQTIRGFIGWTAGMLLQVVPQGGYDVAITWPWKKWAFTLGIAALPGIMGFMRGGDPNPTNDELLVKVHEAKLARVEAGIETTGAHPLSSAPVLPNP
jgi:hypothetical protein